MATLYLVRHGQASFGAKNYDQLSALGEQQAARLGAYWAERGMLFDAVHTGTLTRHRQTLGGMQSAHAALAGVKAQEHAAFNEYNSEALISSWLAAQNLSAGSLGDAKTPAGYKQHFRALRQALNGWIEGALNPPGMPSFAQFQSGLAAQLQSIAAAHGANRSAKVLLVSSGGPISTLVMHTLNAPAGSLIDLNYQLRNAAVSSLQLSPKNVALASFNEVAHLDVPGEPHWITST